MKIRGPEQFGVPLSGLNVSPGDVVWRDSSSCGPADYYIRTVNGGWLRLRDGLLTAYTPPCDSVPLWRRAGTFVEQPE